MSIMVLHHISAIDQKGIFLTSFEDFFFQFIRSLLEGQVKLAELCKLRYSYYAY